jgi:hypothetical protein
MTDTRFGHYGMPGLLIAVAGLLALVLHLAVPYAHVNYTDPDRESETLSRGEIVDTHKNYDMIGASSPGVTLAGSIILLAAGVLIMALSFTPLSVSIARWSGWTLGLVATVGGTLALMSSAFWVGSGLGLFPYGSFNFGNMGFGPNMPNMSFSFGGLTGGLTGLIELALGTDNAGTVIVIGPILVTLAAALGVFAAFTLCGNVISARDGLRDRASQHLLVARWAVALLLVTLLVPWSIGKATDYEGNGDRDWFVHGAHTVMNANAVDGGTYGGMSYALNVLLAAAWIGILLGVIGSFGGVLASENGPAAVARAFHYTTFGTMFMTGYVAVVYVLMWVYMWRPAKDVEDYQPGYLGVLLVPVLAVWFMVQFDMLRSVLNRPASRNSGEPRKTVSFD